MTTSQHFAAARQALLRAHQGMAELNTCLLFLPHLGKELWELIDRAKACQTTLERLLDHMEREATDKE